MIVTRFDPAHELILVWATVGASHARSRRLRMALDTGSSETLVVPDVTDELGYGARTGMPSPSSGLSSVENRAT